MIDIVLAITVWYGLGFVAAAWAVHKGHAVDLWFIGAALWGAIMALLLIVVRLVVLARPTQLQLPMRSTSSNGLHALLLVHVEDSPKHALAPLAGMALELSALDIVVLVSEEASSRWIESPDIAKAEKSLHRILRATPPVETSAAISSISGLQRMARSGWQADLVIVSPQVHEHRISTIIARSMSRLGHIHNEPLDPSGRPSARPRPRPRPLARPRPSTRVRVRQRVDAP